jgi:hypothetical protein
MPAMELPITAQLGKSSLFPLLSEPTWASKLETWG